MTSKVHPAPLLLMIGHRADAVLAARALGLRVALLDSKPPVRKWLKEFEFVDLEDIKDDTTHLPPHLIQKYRRLQINLVLGLTEKSVVPAAYLRNDLEISGLDFETTILCHDKYKMKEHARLHHLPITDFAFIEDNVTAESLVEQLGLPLVIKQRSSSGSRDLTLNQTLEDVRKNMKTGYLAEKYIHGREISIESLLQNGKILFKSMTEYYLHHSVNIVPAQVQTDPSLLSLKNQLWELNEKIISAFGVTTGITHIEFYLSPTGPIFGELAVRPPGGFLMNLIEGAYQFNPWHALLEIGMGKDVSVPQKASCTAANWILHPGGGRVKEVSGISELEKIPEIVDIKHSMKEGLLVKTREGSGENKGRLFFKAERYEQMVAAIEKARATLNITME